MANGGVPRPKRSSTGVVGLLILLLSACAESPVSPATSPAPTDGPLAIHTTAPAGGDGAALEGVLEYDGTCLTVVTEFDERYLPVFAHVRASWDGEALTHEGRRTEPGQRITLGGGGGTHIAAGVYAPEGCDFDFVFYVAANPWACAFPRDDGRPPSDSGNRRAYTADLRASGNGASAGSADGGMTGHPVTST